MWRPATSTYSPGGRSSRSAIPTATAGRCSKYRNGRNRTTRDRYTHGHHDSVLRSHRWRTAENSAAYLVPLLAPGLRLLDVGCGPGTITADLAGSGRPGHVVAIDNAAADVEAQVDWPTRRSGERHGRAGGPLPVGVRGRLVRRGARPPGPAALAPPCGRSGRDAPGVPREGSSRPVKPTTRRRVVPAGPAARPLAGGLLAVARATAASRRPAAGCWRGPTPPASTR